VTRIPLSRSKGQRAKVTILTAVLTHQPAAAVTLGTFLTVGTYCYVAVCRRGWLGGARRFGAHRRSRGAGTYCGGFPHSLFNGMYRGLLPRVQDKKNNNNSPSSKTYATNFRTELQLFTVWTQKHSSSPPFDDVV